MSDYEHPETIVVPAAPGYFLLTLETPEDETPLRQPIVAWRVKHEPERYEGTGARPVVPARTSALTRGILMPWDEVHVEAFDGGRKLLRFKSEAEWLVYARQDAADTKARREQHEKEEAEKKAREQAESERWRREAGVSRA